MLILFRNTNNVLIWHFLQKWCSLDLVDYTCAESILLDDVEAKSKIKEAGLCRSAPFYAVFAEFNMQNLDDRNAEMFSEQVNLICIYETNIIAQGGTLPYS